MRKMGVKILGLILFLIIVIISCDEDDKVKEISKNGSIETVMSVDHLNANLDIVKTSYKIWVKNILVKTVIHTDTLPSLGLTTEEGENSDGDIRKVTLKKDYEIFITVK